MWTNTVGHKKQIEQLKKSLLEKRVAHAYLFSGIEGIGKKRVAYGFAQALNCLDVKNIPCEKCSACTKIEKNTHPDCHFLEPVGQTIKVEILRELKHKVYLHPLEGRSKVVIIDKAQTMTDAGANALLKILEEPPAQTFFILISSQPTRLLPTIRSRCQHLEFSPLSEEEIKQCLAKEKIVAEEATQRAKFAQGSLQAALNFDSELFEQTKNQIETLGANPKPSLILDLSEAWFGESEKIPFILTTLNHLWYKKILETLDKDESEQLTMQWGAIQSANRSLETYANKQLLLESLLFTLTRS